MTGRSPVATRATEMFSDLEAVAQRARDLASADLERPEADTGGPMEERVCADIGRAAREARAAVLGSGARALEKMSKEPEAALAPDEELGLEAIVLLEGRPAIVVRDGDFWPPPPEWAVLDEERAGIRESIARVGRIEVDGHPDYDWIGTGFLVGPDTVMTNRHVAREFSRRDGTTWRFIRGRTAGVDLRRELGNPAELTFAVTEVVGVHDSDDVDLAILRVEPTGSNGADLPTPLPLSATAPDELVGRPVYVVGYPAWDGRRNEPEVIRRIFMDVYNVKQLQPGMLTAGSREGRTVMYDCSTLGGNSGSPVFDLRTHRVIGLHFGGRYRQGNYGVALWSIVDDALVRGAGLNFVDGR